MSSAAAILTYSFGSESLDQDPLLIFSGDKFVPIAVRHHFQRHTEETLRHLQWPASGTGSYLQVSGHAL